MADMELDMMADMEVHKVADRMADMEVDKVANMVAEMAAEKKEWLTWSWT